MCEDPPAMAQCFTYPPSPAFERFIDLVLKTFCANGKNYEIAYTQYALLAQNVATPQAVTVLTQKVAQALSHSKIVSLYKKAVA